MLACSLAVLCLLQSPPDKKPEPPAIAGVVVNQATGDPIKGVQVTLSSDNASPVRAQTDAAGRFRFAGLQPGSYTIGTERVGFVALRRSAYGFGERVISVEAGRGVEDLRLPLMPHAVITGRVLDEDGSPAPGIFVNVLEYRYDAAGKRRLTETAGAGTNDLGEYRISGLRPGTYYLRAVPGDIGATAIVGVDFPQPAAGDRYAPVYYPNAAGPEDASRVKVDAGRELSGMDLRLRKVHAVRVRGRVVGIPPGKFGPIVAFVHLDARGMPFSGLSGGAGMPKPDSDGAFELRGVIPGAYTLTAQAIDFLAPENERSGYTAEQDIDVGDTDVEDLVVSLRPPVDVAGIVRFTGKPAQVMVSLFPVIEGRSGFAASGNLVATPKDDGTFSIRRVPAGRYRVTGASMNGEWHIRTARLGPADVLEDGLDLTVGAPSGRLEIVFAQGTARVEGSAKAGALVVLVPAAAAAGALMEPYRLQTVADQNGRFRLERLLPGEYQAWAFGDDVEDGAWLDPDFRKAHAAESVPVKLSDNATEKLSLATGPRP